MKKFLTNSFNSFKSSFKLRILKHLLIDVILISFVFGLWKLVSWIGWDYVPYHLKLPGALDVSKMSPPEMQIFLTSLKSLFFYIIISGTISILIVVAAYSFSVWLEYSDFQKIKLSVKNFFKLYGLVFIWLAITIIMALAGLTTVYPRFFFIFFILLFSVISAMAYAFFAKSQKVFYSGVLAIKTFFTKFHRLLPHFLISSLLFLIIYMIYTHVYLGIFTYWIIGAILLVYISWYRSYLFETLKRI